MLRPMQTLTLTGLLLLLQLAGCSNGSDNERRTVEEDVQAQELCNIPEEDIQVNTTATNIEFVRTPDACFDNLDGYPFTPNYVEVEGLRYHFVDEGPRDGEVILMLHGQPSWSYLYRKMIPVLAEAGYRVIAPDHIGMGRSDKPVDPRVHQFEQHVGWMKSFVSELGLTDITLFVQDWGSHIGLRMAGDNPDNFARIVVANGDLVLIPEGLNPFTVPVFEFDETIEGTVEYLSQRPSDRVGSFQHWINFAATAPHLFAADMIDIATVDELTDAQFASYNAPYPARIYWGGIRAFPSMVAGIEMQNAPAYGALGRFHRPFMFLGGENDPNQGSVENQNKWIAHVPGAVGQEHRRYLAGHFIQEDVGEEMAAHVVEFMQRNPGFNSLFIGHSFFRPFAQGMPNYSGAAGIAGHTQSIVSSGGASGAPQALWENATKRGEIQAILNSGDIELFAMTYHGDYPTTEGYENWINYALAQNPNTRIALALPWGPGPESTDAATYASGWNLAHSTAWHDFVDTLRGLYPGVDIYCIPYGQSAGELRLLLAADNLPDVQNLVGNAADSIYTDRLGHPGHILRDLGRLVWLNAIYDVDLSTYSYGPVYTTDLKGIAQSIMAGHDPDYDAAYHVDVDGDRVGDIRWTIVH